MAYDPEAQRLRGWDQGQADAWKAFDDADAFGLGYQAGELDERKKHEDRDRWLRRISDAVVDGTIDDLARSCGAMPDDVDQGDVDKLLGDIARWLEGGGDDGPA
jgi:hypothetical protein